MSVAIQHHYADLEQVTLHYLTAGRGDPVVLLHGIPQTSFEWRHIMPRLAETYTVIAPDLRGLGDSSRPLSGYDKKTVANDIWQLVHEHLNIKSFYLVGHDWGGPTAFSLASQHRDAVRKLAILDVVVPGDGPDFSQNGRRWHHPLFRTHDLPEVLFSGREVVLLEWFFENYGFRANCISQQDRAEYYRAYTRFGAFRAMFGYYRALPQDITDNKEMLSRLGPLKMPVLALGGAKSFGRGMETVESLKRVAVDVRGGVVPDCGHWIAEEAPEFLLSQLLDFFRDEPGYVDHIRGMSEMAITNERTGA